MEGWQPLDPKKAGSEYLWWLSQVLARFLSLMAVEAVPLSEPVIVACVLSDLCAIAGLPVPVEVERAIVHFLTTPTMVKYAR
jgi:hypothetical protein